MKTLPTLVLLALICVLLHTSAGARGPSLVTAPQCCPRFTRTFIPKAEVKRVAKTSSYCRVPAVIVTSVCGKMFCIDPDWRWAKNLLTEFKKRTANRLPLTPFNTSKCQKKKRV